MQSKRQQEFKKGVTSEDGRRRRGEAAMQIRKNHKEESLAKRRNIMMNNFVSESKTEEAPAPVVPDASKYQSLVADLHSNDASVQYNAVKAFRQMLSVEVNPPVQPCIDCGAVPIFVQFLSRTDCPQLQFEAAWALTNIASTVHTSVVVEYNAIPPLITQLISPSAEVREQCAWCLGNIAGDCTKYRDMILKQGALEPLLQNITQPENISLLRNCTWTLSNFCRGKPQPKFKLIQNAIPILAAILNSCGDESTLVDACWAMSYLSDGSDDQIQCVIEHNIIPVLIKMLTCDKVAFIVPALRTLGNIVSGNDKQTQAVIDHNVVPAILPLLRHTKKNIRKESCWMLSNIAAGSMEQVTMLVNTPNLVPLVLTQLDAATEWDVRKEATWVISNIACSGSKHNIMKMVEYGVISPLCELLDVAEVRVLQIALEALEHILRVGATCGINVPQLIDEAGGIDRLENLQEHSNEDIYEKSVRLIETYFGSEEVASENLVPQVSANNTYSFGLADTKQVAQSQGFNFAMNANSSTPFF